jgi:hypothetical protein
MSFRVKNCKTDFKTLTLSCCSVMQQASFSQRGPKCVGDIPTSHFSLHILCFLCDVIATRSCSALFCLLLGLCRCLLAKLLLPRFYFHIFLSVQHLAHSRLS